MYPMGPNALYGLRRDFCIELKIELVLIPDYELGRIRMRRPSLIAVAPSTAY